MTTFHSKDERGDLVAVEFNDLPFQPIRSFVVSTDKAGSRRGGHKVGCRQIIVLTAGSISCRITNGSGEIQHVEMIEIGSTLELASDDFIEYTLHEAGSSILVLADKTYKESSKDR